MSIVPMGGPCPSASTSVQGTQGSSLPSQTTRGNESAGEPRLQETIFAPIDAGDDGAFGGWMIYVIAALAALVCCCGILVVIVIVRSRRRAERQRDAVNGAALAASAPPPTNYAAIRLPGEPDSNYASTPNDSFDINYASSSPTNSSGRTHEYGNVQTQPPAVYDRIGDNAVTYQNAFPSNSTASGSTAPYGTYAPIGFQQNQQINYDTAMPNQTGTQ